MSGVRAKRTGSWAGAAPARRRGRRAVGSARRKRRILGSPSGGVGRAGRAERRGGRSPNPHCPVTPTSAYRAGKAIAKRKRVTGVVQVPAGATGGRVIPQGPHRPVPDVPFANGSEVADACRAGTSPRQP